MKTHILLVTIGAALTAMTLNTHAGNISLTPRAAGNQIQHFAGTYNDPNLAGTTGRVVATPRAAGNQAATVAGINREMSPAAACVSNMSGSPKVIQACAEHPATMPGCNPAAVASLK